MIRQEVNLYTAEFRRGEQPLSGRIIVGTSVGLLVLLLLVQAVTTWNLSRARSELDLQRNEERLVSERLQVLRASRQAGRRSELERQIETLHREVERREELKSLISGQNLGNAAGFSPYLESLARQADESISLSQIRLLDGGDYLELAGWTRRPESVPYYLRKLREEKSFQNVKFGVLGIRNNDEHRHKLEFYLGRPEGGPS
ncbi:hypothetical protein F6455_17660 [Proteobacteria bacterium 005FR1]|nr:hypothetical protein [Proteobacteria bacterium 005FR1]